MVRSRLSFCSRSPWTFPSSLGDAPYGGRRIARLGVATAGSEKCLTWVKPCRGQRASVTILRQIQAGSCRQVNELLGSRLRLESLKQGD